MSTYEKELMAVVTAVRKWAPYIMDKHFYIKTDHWALKYLTEQKVSNLLHRSGSVSCWDTTILFSIGRVLKVQESQDFTTNLHEDMDAFKGEGLSDSEA